MTTHRITPEPRETPPYSDRDLLERVARGDTAAFAALYDQLAPRVYGLCRTILHDPRHAEDAALDALLEIWRTAPRYDPTCTSPLTWALTITRHRAVDHVRALRAHPARRPRRQP